MDSTYSVSRSLPVVLGNYSKVCRIYVRSTVGAKTNEKVFLRNKRKQVFGVTSKQVYNFLFVSSLTKTIEIYVIP